jgi:hypothetical protein
LAVGNEHLEVIYIWLRGFQHLLDIKLRDVNVKRC